MSLAKHFGENLRRARKRQGYSQEELAVRASLHRTEIGLVERGERLVRLDPADVDAFLEARREEAA